MKKRNLCIIYSSLFLLSCGNQTPSNVTDASTTKMKIKFKALANNQDIECGKTYNKIGTTNSDISFSDFRMYISNVRLIDDKDKEVKLNLEQDKKWQNGDLALLDFENNSGDCASGTSETNKEISGTVPKGNYKSVKFTLGVPFEMNHQDVNKAGSPLNLTSMFWVWNSGYKFVRIDMKTKGLTQGYFIHLGSTGCMGAMTTKHDMSSDINATKPPVSCMNPNRPEIILENFNPEKNAIVADVSQLLSDSNVDANQENTPEGCMSGLDDSDCKQIMNNFGLNFGDSVTKGQKFFRVE